MNHYLVPVRYKETGNFAFMLVIESNTLYEAKVIATHIYNNDLQEHLYIDDSKDFKEYKVA
ncbi:TPA: hypothetical protein VCH52_001698 [Streptococcus pyogenes]|nr:hypothetical protein [Streptococcus pyogenes]